MNNNLFFPIHEIIEDQDGHGLILGKNGTLTYVVRMIFPEVYSLYKDELEQRHSVFVQAFSHMPDNSYIHKQDVYLKKVYRENNGNSFLAKAENEHFNGREYLEHESFLAFTLAGLNFTSDKYVGNIFAFDDTLNKEDLERIDTFMQAVQYVITHIASLQNTRVLHLSIQELKDIIFCSANFYERGGIKDIHISNEITAGSCHARLYSITDDEFLGNSEYLVANKDYAVSQDKTDLYMSLAESFGGIHLNYNHIYNQLFFFYSDKLLKDKMRKNLDDHIRNRGWDKVNFPAKIKALESLSNEIMANKEILCYAHFSVMLWEDDDNKLDISEKAFKSAMDLCNINYYVPGYGNLADIYGGNIIGNAASLAKQYFFLTTLSLSCCFLTHYSTFKNDKEGVLFNERLNQIPLRKDIWDASGKRIKARNAIVVAPTGSGKSFLTNNIIYQLLDTDYIVVAVEFGNSFKQLCNLYSDISLHIEYSQDMPLGLNPFDLEGGVMTAEKEDTLVTLCLRFWRKPDADANLVVALRKFLADYYRENKSGHSFQSFYSYLTKNYSDICKRCQVKEEYFDIASFTHVCSEFMPGGIYANLCASDGIASNLSQKRFIHFELTKVKASPFVASIVMSLLFDVINNKILSDTSKKGYIIFDEYAETAQMKPNNAMDVDVHQTVAFFYQKIRKENGAVMTVIQSPAQLPANEYTKGIISNTQLLYVLEGTEVVYDAVIETFKIKNQAHINQMKSIRNCYSAARPYSECWIRFGENYAITVRLEASRKKYLAFQTQGEIRAALDGMYNANGHNMQKAIEDYITINS